MIKASIKIAMTMGIANSLKTAAKHYVTAIVYAIQLSATPQLKQLLNLYPWMKVAILFASNPA